MAANKRKPLFKSLNYERIGLVGQQMSNLCFNLSQSDKIPTEYRATMRELYQQWDAAIRPQKGEASR